MPESSQKNENKKIMEIQHLTDAFELFNQKISVLENAYSSLQTQFKSVNHQLEKKNNELHAILTHISQGIIFITLSGTITTCNKAAMKITEITEQTLSDSNYWDLFSDDFFGFSMKEALSQKKPLTLTNVKLPSEKKVEILADFVLTEKESSHGMILVIRDITELCRLQAVESRNDRLKELGEMAASIAHEIRNPLGGIEGFASLLARDLENELQMQQMALKIVQGSRTLNNLVNNVLNYARPIHINYSYTNLASLLTEVEAIFNADSKLSSQTKLTLFLPENECNAKIDKDSIKSALLNIIINGVQAMPEGGNITMSLTNNNESVLISIHDEGIGIQDESIEKIFSPFYTTKTKGNGFGLSEVNKVVQAHNGKVNVSSQPGETTFTITLPKSQ